MSYKNLHNCRSDDKSYGCIALYILIFYDFRILVKFVFMFVCRPMYVCMYVFFIICIFCMCCSRGLIDDNDNNNRYLRACDCEL